MSRSLIIVRAGRNSLHPEWLGVQPNRDWDLFICPYEETSFVAAPENGVFLGDVLPGQKWSGLRLLLARWDGWRDYDYIVLADDDIATTSDNWSAFFAECRASGAMLAQPALSPGSYLYWLITSKNEAFKSRKVTFVEIMMPCFHRDALAQLMPTFALTETGFGFGFDFLWPHLLDYQRLFIFDSTAVRHTRPVGGARNADIHKANLREAQAIISKYGLNVTVRTLAGLDHQGKELTADSVEFLHAYLKGYWHILSRGQNQFQQLLQHQLGLRGLKP